MGGCVDGYVSKLYVELKIHKTFAASESYYRRISYRVVL